MNGMSMVSRIKDFLRTRVMNSRLMMIYILDIFYMWKDKGFLRKYHWPTTRRNISCIEGICSQKERTSVRSAMTRMMSEPVAAEVVLRSR